MIPLLIALLFAQVQADQVTGTISGRINFGDGRPAANTRVMAIAAGEEQTVDTAIMTSALTDGSGRYRLEKVPPGRYYIAAGLVQSPSYFPGATTQAAATAVTVAPGANLQRYDFEMVSLRVAGRFVRANSEPVRVGRGHEVRLTLGIGQSLTARVADDGTYEFPNVPRGVFTLAARAPLTATTAQVVVADQDVTGVNLVLAPIKVVTGRVIVEGGGPPPRFALNTLETAPTAGAAAIPVKVMISTERLFTLRLHEGEQPMSVAPESLPGGYTVKAFRYGRLDLLKQPLRVGISDTDELVITLQSPRERRARISGRLVPYDASMPTAVVKLESPSFVGSSTAVVGEDGSFRFSDVMAGSYTLTSNLSGTSAPAVVVGPSDIENIQITVPVVATADPEQVIGSISWIIYEAFSGAVVDQGNGPVRTKDISLRERGQPPGLSTQKILALNRQFSLVMDESVTEWSSAKTSLTFTVRHSDYETRSYEYFRIESPTLARERQDAVDLAIALAEVAPRRWEVTRAEFLTDFSIPVSHSAMVPRGSPYWRVVILKGSNITWPSLINGKTVGN